MQNNFPNRSDKNVYGSLSSHTQTRYSHGSIVAVLLIAAAFVVVVGGLFASGSAYRSSLDNLYAGGSRQVVVKDGDTLWGIASSYGYDNLDTGDVVDAIAAQNNLDSVGAINEGDVLTVPAQ